MLETRQKLTPEEEREKRIQAAASDIKGAKKIFEKRKKKEGDEATPLSEFVIGEKREDSLDLIYETITEANPKTAKDFEKIARYDHISNSLDFDEEGDVKPIPLETDERGIPTMMGQLTAANESRRRTSWKENAAHLKEETIEEITESPQVAELFDADTAKFFVDLIQEKNRLEAEFDLLLTRLENNASRNENKAPESLSQLAAALSHVSKYREILLQKRLTKKMTESLQEKNKSFEKFVQAVMDKYHEAVAEFINRYVRSEEKDTKAKKDTREQKNVSYKSAGAYTIYMTQNSENQARDGELADFIKLTIGRGQKGASEVKIPLFKVLSEEFGLPYPEYRTKAAGEGEEEENKKYREAVKAAQKSLANQLYIAIDEIDKFREVEKATEAMPRKARRANSR